MKFRWKMCLVALEAVALAACSEGSGVNKAENPSSDNTNEEGSNDGGQSTTDPGQTPSEETPVDPKSPTDPTLAERRIDYSEALRTVALKLLGTLPTLDEAVAVRDRASYEAQVDRYLEDPRIRGQLLAYFRNMMKMGGNIEVAVGDQRVTVSLDTAPRFATLLALEDRPITELFTATQGTCPTVGQDGTITPADCPASSGGVTAGVLTDPGAMAQFYSAMAFRRVRWVQETFDCTQFPAEYVATPTMIGTAQYSSPWPFTSIAGSMTNAPIDFHDTSAVVCANCHSTMNHMAPLFANYDAAGRLQMTVQVRTPTPDNPITELSHWLPPGENLAWRFGDPANNLQGLGQAMARDPAVMRCQVARAWNWAMGKTDITDDLALVPPELTAELEASFERGGFRMRPLLRAIFTHDDFVRF